TALVTSRQEAISIGQRVERTEPHCIGDSLGPFRGASPERSDAFFNCAKDGTPKQHGAALAARLPEHLQMRGARNSQAQPARKHNPPNGVIAPSQRRLVNAIAYKLPLKRKIPAQNNHEAPR